MIVRAHHINQHYIAMFDLPQCLVGALIEHSPILDEGALVGEVVLSGAAVSEGSGCLGFGSQ
mgnify:CR=1 FL=1